MQLNSKCVYQMLACSFYINMPLHQAGHGDNHATVQAASSKLEGEPIEGPSEEIDRRTAAERRYDETQAKRAAEKTKKMATKSHRERVAEFNAHLASLSEHHDIPKVGPG